MQANCTDVFDPETCVSDSPLTWNRNGQAIKVYKVPGNTKGDNYFDLTNWKTGFGGTWENWYIENGILSTSKSEKPACGF